MELELSHASSRLPGRFRPLFLATAFLPDVGFMPLKGVFSSAKSEKWPDSSQQSQMFQLLKNHLLDLLRC